mgnify:CR=1 FL=1
MNRPEKMVKYELDATNQPLGRLSTQVAMILMGKNKPDYTPHIDNRNKVIITNIAGIKLTGNKIDQKEYYRHSGYPGGLKTTTVKKLLKENPEEVLRKAVSRMLPKNRLLSARMQRISFK